VAFTNTAQNASSLLWFFGDNTSATLFNPFHLYPGPDCYLVTQIATNNCGSDTLEQYLALGVDPSGCGVNTNWVENDISDVLQLMPNPNHGEFSIVISDENLKLSDIKIYSIHGQLIREISNIQNNEKTIQINLEDAIPGMYILVCHSEKGSTRFKFSKL
jgi:hypothetical protein